MKRLTPKNSDAALGPEDLERRTSGCLSGVIAPMVALTIVLALTISSYKIAILGQVLTFLAEDSGSYTVRSSLVMFGTALILMTLVSAWQFVVEFGSTDDSGTQQKFFERVKTYSLLCRKKTGYVGALIAKISLRITMHVLITSISFSIFNASDNFNDPDISDVLNLFSISLICINLIVILIYASFISILVERIIRDAELEGIDE